MTKGLNRTATALLALGCCMGAGFVASNGLADVPQAPRLIDSNSEAEPETAGGNPVLRDYLRGHAQHGWNEGQIGKPEEFWNQKVTSLPVDPTSASVTQYLGYVSRGDKSDPSTEFFGQFDMGSAALDQAYSHNVLIADSNTPKYEYTERTISNGFREDDVFVPHCDRLRMPVPVGGRLQNEFDYQCTTQGDCHLYVLNPDTGILYEQWRAYNPGPDPRQYTGGCSTSWDLTVKQPPELRGLSCTSANAAGVPYTPMIVTPGEIKAGVIRHALAFTMPNAWVQRDVYARPATHNPLRSQTWGQPEAAPGTPMLYGSRFRLRSNFVIDPSWPPALQVVLQALKDYGMFHIDGGPRMIITSNDYLSEHTWIQSDINLRPYDLTQTSNITWSDFELVSDSRNINSMNDIQCSRDPVYEF